MENINDSVIFEWDPEEFPNLLASCYYDDAIQLSLKYMTNKDARILEAGCGSGRAVKYFNDLGYNAVFGIELNADIVRTQNARHPELNILQGDILQLPYGDNFFDVVVSYGVVEHFPKGLDAPLKAILRSLKPVGIAIITVPSMNKLRQIKYFFGKPLHFLSIKENNLVRKLFKRAPLPKKRNDEGYLYYVRPQFGHFYEYRLKPNEFEDACLKAGFAIIESIPILHIDGLYHEMGFVFRKLFLSFDNWQFHVSKLAHLLNNILKRIHFFHNHMHACVLRKPSGSAG